mmetsp:Transcript_31572/g.66116  ORF Transcript_31572/g.66116 Transcript_31572/m.66116 type:complete len:234 (+) Transcript_31572:3116-3817(+)
MMTLERSMPYCGEIRSRISRDTLGWIGIITLSPSIEVRVGARAVVPALQRTRTRSLLPGTMRASTKERVVTLLLLLLARARRWMTLRKSCWKRHVPYRANECRTMLEEKHLRMLSTSINKPSPLLLPTRTTLLLNGPPIRKRRKHPRRLPLPTKISTLPTPPRTLPTMTWLPGRPPPHSILTWPATCPEARHSRPYGKRRRFESIPPERRVLVVVTTGIRTRRMAVRERTTSC